MSNRSYVFFCHVCVRTANERQCHIHIGLGYSEVRRAWQFLGIWNCLKNPYCICKHRHWVAEWFLCVCVYACIICWKFATEMWNVNVFFHRKKNWSYTSMPRSGLHNVLLSSLLLASSFMLFFPSSSSSSCIVSRAASVCSVPLKSKQMRTWNEQNKIFFILNTNNSTSKGKKQNDTQRQTGREKERETENNWTKWHTERFSLKSDWKCYGIVDVMNATREEKNAH